jgi:hypothetical protein
MSSHLGVLLVTTIFLPYTFCFQQSATQWLLLPQNVHGIIFLIRFMTLECSSIKVGKGDLYLTTFLPFFHDLLFVSLLSRAACLPCRVLKPFWCQFSMSFPTVVSIVSELLTVCTMNHQTLILKRSSCISQSFLEWTLMHFNRLGSTLAIFSKAFPLPVSKLRYHSHTESFGMFLK